MANKKAEGTAVFPAGLVLRMESDGVVLGNQGDVVVEGNLAESLGDIKHVFSESGSLHLSSPTFKAETIEAPGGEIVLKGNVTAARIKGQVIRHSDGKLEARVILADGEIELTGKTVKAEVVMAPKVSFGSNTKGRATAVQCDNEIGASKVRGCLSLTDFVAIVSGAEDVLKENGIPIPDDDDEEDDEDEQPPGGEEEPAEPDERAGAPPGDESSDEGEIVVEDSVDDAAEVEVDAAEVDVQSEDEQLDLAEDDDSGGAPPQGTGAGLTAEDITELTAQLEGALEKIYESYAQGEVPPPVVFLQSLVAEQRFDYIKMQINSIWSDLLKYHQKKGLYISNAVTHQFQQIQLAMRKIPEA